MIIILCRTDGGGTAWTRRGFVPLEKLHIVWQLLVRRYVISILYYYYRQGNIANYAKFFHYTPSSRGDDVMMREDCRGDYCTKPLLRRKLDIFLPTTLWNSSMSPVDFKATTLSGLAFVVGVLLYYTHYASEENCVFTQWKLNKKNVRRKSRFDVRMLLYYFTLTCITLLSDIISKRRTVSSELPVEA